MTRLLGQASIWAQKRDKFGSLLFLLMVSLAPFGLAPAAVGVGVLVVWYVLFSPFTKT